jgi:hypothetical protein
VIIAIAIVVMIVIGMLMMPMQLARAQRTRGRRKSQPRMVLEELPCINANWLSRRKLFPKDWSTRRYSFDFQNPAVIRSLTLGPRCAEFVFVTGQTQLIPIGGRESTAYGEAPEPHSNALAAAATL